MKLSDEHFAVLWRTKAVGGRDLHREIADAGFALGVEQARRVKPLDRFGLVHRGYAVSIDEQEKRYVAELAHGGDAETVGMYPTDDNAWEACQAHHTALILSAMEDV